MSLRLFLYLLKKILFWFAFYLFCLFFLFIFTDLAFHLHRVTTAFSWQAWFLYEICFFSLQAELLLPLAFLLSSSQIFLSLLQNGELLALRTQGYSRLQIMIPFIAIGFAGGFSLCSFETFLYANCLEHKQLFETLHYGKKSSTLSIIPVQSNQFFIFNPQGDLFFFDSSGELIVLKRELIEEDSSANPGKVYSWSKNEKGEWERASLSLPVIPSKKMIQQGGKESLLIGLFSFGWILFLLLTFGFSFARHIQSFFFLGKIFGLYFLFYFAIKHVIK